MPSARLLLCRVKNVTVMGIMGKTQGVRRATSPEMKAARKKAQRLSSSAGGGVTPAVSVPLEMLSLLIESEETAVAEVSAEAAVEESS